MGQHASSMIRASVPLHALFLSPLLLAGYFPACHFAFTVTNHHAAGQYHRPCI